MRTFRYCNHLDERKISPFGAPHQFHSKGLKSARPIKVMAYQIDTNTSDAIILLISFMAAPFYSAGQFPCSTGL